MDLSAIHFADPNWLLGLLALPAVLTAVFFLSRAKHSTFFMGNPRLVEAASGFFSAQLVPWGLRLLVLALCLVAAARPQAGKKKVEEKRPVTDLFVAFDVSTSMLADDLKPNRMVAAKQILADFLGKVENVRMGLTVFARISFTQCPLTTDMEVMKRLLEKVDVFSVKLDGTAIGDALVSSLNRLQTGSGKKPGDEGSKPSVVGQWLGKAGEDREPPANHQAIILMTDGSNNAGRTDPLTAAKIAATRGVKIYAIGMGTPEGVPAPYILPDGRITYALDQNGNVIKTSLDIALLNEVARLTGGKAYTAGDNRSLQSVLNEIAKLEKRDVAVTVHWEYQELASLFLLAAFILLALDIALETTILRTLP
jgi:Ca-activated chloride channel homolog